MFIVWELEHVWVWALEQELALQGEWVQGQEQQPDAAEQVLELVQEQLLVELWDVM